jgi:hypothetical protein
VVVIDMVQKRFGVFDPQPREGWTISGVPRQLLIHMRDKLGWMNAYACFGTQAENEASE